MERLEEEIYRLRYKRDLLRNDVSNLKTRIRYYKERLKKTRKSEYARKIKEAKKELERAMREYEELKEQVNALVKEWRELRCGKR